MIQNYLLKRKIKEYFLKNPIAESVVVKSDLGSNRVFWKVSKNKGKLDIVEVTTLRKEYSINEAPVVDPNLGGFPGTAPVRTNVAPSGADPWDPMDQNGSFQRLVKTVGVQKAMSSMPEDRLKKHFGMDRRTLLSKTNPNQLTNSKVNETNILEATPAQQAVVKMAQAIATADAKTWSTPEGKKDLLYTYNQLAHQMDDTSKKAIKDLLSSIGISEKDFNAASSGQYSTFGTATGASTFRPLSNSIQRESVIVEDEKSDEKSKDEEEPKDKPEDKLADKPEEEPKEKESEQEDVPSQRMPTEEEGVLNKALSGQTIKEAHVEFSPNGGSLTLLFVNSNIPFILQWDNSGKVGFSTKGRPYKLHNG